MTARTRHIVLLGAATAAFLASLTGLSDWDTFFHLAYGRDILRRGGFALEDPFLYPLAGLPSGAQPSWLGSVVIYLSWLAAGDPGPVYLAGLMGATLVLVLLVDGIEDDRTLAGLAAVLLPVSFALAVFRDRAVARPELFSNVLLAGTLLALRRYAAGKSRLLLFFPAAAAVWVNLHQTVLAGAAVIAIFVLVNAGLLLVRRFGLGISAGHTGPRALFAPTVALLGGIVAAAVLNPSGPAGVVSPVAMLGAVVGATGLGPGAAPVDLVSRAVDELRAPTQAQLLGPFGWLVVLCAVSFLCTWRRIDLRELLTCLAFLCLALKAQRFLVLGALVMAPIAGCNLRGALTRLPAAVGVRVRRGAIAAATIGVIAAAWSMMHIPGIRFGIAVGREMPVRAAAYLKSIGFAGRLFNTFHLGGYLEWTLDRPVFQDGRGNLLPADAAAALAGPSSYAKFEALDARYRFDALVTYYPQFAGVAFQERAERIPGSDWGADRRKWALVAFDDGGQVYLRRDGGYAGSAARDEYRYAKPTNPLILPQMENPARLQDDLQRSLREASNCLRCRTMLGFLLNDLGRTAEAEAMLLPAATDGLPETQLYALFGLALAAESRGDRAAAASRWREIVALAPDPLWSRRQLARVLLEDGRLGEAWAAIRRNLGRGETVEDLAVAIQIARARGDTAEVRDLSKRLAAAVRSGG